MARFFAAIVLGTTLLATQALAQNAAAQNAPPHPRELPGHGPVQLDPSHGAPRPTPGAPRPTPERGGHAQPAGHGDAAAHTGHAAHAEHDEKAPPPPINWWHGLLGEKEGVAPSLLWREPGEPAPFLASVLNFALLAFLVVRFGKKPLTAALVKRKETIMREIDDAQKMRKAAEERLREYEGRLEKISDELDRVRREFREQGERDKERIVLEAKERRERMQKDTEILLGQEAKQMRQELLAEVVSESTRLAADLLSKSMTLGDHDRFADSFLDQLRARSAIGGPRKVGPS